MAGNVWEWTSSSLDSNRVFCGGGWYSYDSDCAVSITGDGIPYVNYSDIGFRVCRWVIRSLDFSFNLYSFTPYPIEARARFFNIKIRLRRHLVDAGEWLSKTLVGTNPGIMGWADKKSLRFLRAPHYWNKISPFFHTSAGIIRWILDLTQTNAFSTRTK